MSKQRKLLLAVFALLIFVPGTIYAATIKSAKQGGSESISQNETVKNAYLAGNSVSFSGHAQQDVVVVGNTLNISGTVSSSLMAAGNSISISGPVGNSIRAAGASINVNSSVGSDLFAAGGSVVLGPDAVVEDDFLAAGGTIDLLGKVKGNARLAGGQININGEVDGNVNIKGGGKISLGDRAVINGNLTYEATEPANISPSAKVMGKTDFTKVEVKQAWGKKAGIISVFALGFLVVSFLTLWLLSYLFPKLMLKFVENGMAKPWENIGIGFVFLVVVPVAAIILLVTIIGAPLGALLFGIYGLGLAIAKLMTPVFVGSMLFKWFGKDKVYKVSWLTILVGVVVATIVGAVPYLGSLAIFIVLLLALSQVAQSLLGFVKSQR